jgi:cystathionine beta-lyase
MTGNLDPSPSFDFDRPVDRRHTASIKWERYAGRDILPMWVADMDFQAPPAVLGALRQRVEHGVFGYTMAPAALVETVVVRLARDYRWQVEPDWIVWLPGLVTGLNVACRAVGNPGSGVLTTVPIYPPFLTAPSWSERTLCTAPLARTGDSWRMDFAAMAQALIADTSLLLFCNPHNPTGRIYSEAELHEVAAFCQRHDLVICADEIHCGLLLDQHRRHIPIATLAPEVAARTITLMAPSKTYNIPGLGVSFAVIPNEKLRRRFQRVMAGIVPHVNALGYTAALAAYRESDLWHASLLDYLRANRDLVESRIGAMAGLTMTHVEATYLAWIDARALGHKDPSAWCEQAGVGLSDGREFDGPGFLRLNFGCRRELLQEALTRMEKAAGRNTP